MRRADIVRSLRETAGGEWITKRRLRGWLCSGDAEAAKMVEGLDYRVQGTARLYFVPDVADIVRQQVVKGEF